MTQTPIHPLPSHKRRYRASTVTEKVITARKLNCEVDDKEGRVVPKY